MSSFKLPEKWAILRNTENHKEVNKWFSEKSGYMFNSRDRYTHYPAVDNTSKTYSRYVKDYLSVGYTEITFEQFQEHVLGYTEEKPSLQEFPKEGYCRPDSRVIALLESLGYGKNQIYLTSPVLAWYWNNPANRPHIFQTLSCGKPSEYGKEYSVEELLSFNNKTNKNELQTTSSETRYRETSRIFGTSGSKSKSLIRGDIGRKQKTFGRTKAGLKEYRVRGELFLS